MKKGYSFQKAHPSLCVALLHACQVIRVGDYGDERSGL